MFLSLQGVGRSNFDMGLPNLITLIKKRHKIIIKMKLLCYIMESTVDTYEKETLLLYICISFHNCPRLIPFCDIATSFYNYYVMSFLNQRY